MAWARLRRDKLVQVISDRYGGACEFNFKAPRSAETSEEVRLALVQLLCRLVPAVAAHSPQGVASQGGRLAEVLMACLMDGYAAVVVEACALAGMYAAALGRRVLGPQGNEAPSIAEILIKAALPALGHRHARVRVAVLGAVEALVFNGGAKALLEMSGHRDANVVPIKAFYEGDRRANYLAAVAGDRNPAVRRALLGTLRRWLLELEERYDYESRLVVYVLAAVSDEVAETRGEAFDAMEALGEAYEKDKREDLKDTVDWMPEDIAGLEDGNVAARCLPHPFCDRPRPRLGARMIAVGAYNRGISALLAECTEHNVESRAAAVRMLRTMLVYVEDRSVQHMAPMLRALAACAGDVLTVEAAEHCCAVLGRATPPVAWLPTLAAALGEAEGALLVGWLKTSTSLCRAAATAGGEATVAAAAAAVLPPLLEHARLACRDAATAAAQRALLEALGSALCCSLERGEIAGAPSVDDAAYALFHASCSDEAARVQLDGLLERLAAAAGEPSVGRLLGREAGAFDRLMGTWPWAMPQDAALAAGALWRIGAASATRRHAEAMLAHAGAAVRGARDAARRAAGGGPSEGARVARLGARAAKLVLAAGAASRAVPSLAANAAREVLTPALGPRWVARATTLAELGEMQVAADGPAAALAANDCAELRAALVAVVEDGDSGEDGVAAAECLRALGA